MVNPVSVKVVPVIFVASEIAVPFLVILTFV